ncbi:PREDICTED: protein DEHYDRATION-INDUCED 19 [Tarenaya hassleriana]|uniref:protein DEHYDRATION-INDUCED 19 n=1 Tax=Tarenaya hassleriana TaxID=28532 RepID=UPI00053C3E0F|nr:PREDICTED: protein DEHYDRATION-INDUCED 19 [Tarenaya hassleriana]
MESDSKRYQSVLRSRSETLMGFEDIVGDDDFREVFPCPFCADSYDIIGLCCHLDDEHPLEAKNGVCPVCSLRVGVDMISHITLQHGNIFKMQQKRKSRKSSSHSTTISLIRKELRDGDLQRLFGIPSCIVSSASGGTPDPLLSPFVLPKADYLVPARAAKKTLGEKPIELQSGGSLVSMKDREEKKKRSEFVQSLLSSTILNEIY